MKYTTLFIGLVLLFSITVSALAQPIREGVNLGPDTTPSITLNELMNPSLQNFLALSGYQQSESNFPQSKSLNLNKTTKTLLIKGTSLIRDDHENHPIYSFEDA